MTAPTRDEVIQMAREAGVIPDSPYLMPHKQRLGLERLVAATYARGVADEREACANVAKNISDKYAYGYYGQEVDTADEIAAAIRARPTPTTTPHKK